MLSNNDNSTPPEWLQRFERRLQSRMNREQDPFKTNSFTTKMMYLMMLTLSVTAWVLIPLHALYTHNIYLIAFLVIGIGLWVALIHHQRKQKRTVWYTFPVSFRDYVQKRSKFFQATWHLIFITLITGFFIMTSRFIGLEDILLPRRVSPTAATPMTPEQKAVYDALEQIKGTAFSRPKESAPPASTGTPPSAAPTKTPPSAPASQP